MCLELHKLIFSQVFMSIYSTTLNAANGTLQLTLVYMLLIVCWSSRPIVLMAKMKHSFVLHYVATKTSIGGRTWSFLRTCYKIIYLTYIYKLRKKLLFSIYFPTVAPYLMTNIKIWEESFRAKKVNCV